MKICLRKLSRVGAGWWGQNMKWVVEKGSSDYTSRTCPAFHPHLPLIIVGKKLVLKLTLAYHVITFK